VTAGNGIANEGVGVKDETKQRIKRPLKRWLRPLNPSIQYMIHRQPNPMHLWRSDPVFQPIWKRAERFTLVEPASCYVLFRAAQHARSLDGDAAELGVYRGGTARVIAEVLSDRAFHLFDTFEGMPAVDSRHDSMNAGDLKDTSVDGVRSVLDGVGKPEFRQGFFPETTAGLEDAKYSFVHVDADIYRSVLDACEYFYPRLSRGGVMVFDDYGFVTTKGARDAVDEFFADKSETPLYLPTGQAVVYRT
jgi:hypothetical protein